jgi:predicted ATPase
VRTTLDIEDDVLQAAKELAAKEGSTAGAILSQLARRGLKPTVVDDHTDIRNGIQLLPRRDEIITLDHVQRLIDEEGA